MGDEEERNFQDSASVDSFLDDFFKNTRTCTHTHTCNPPGPDATHTHTCYHTHTQVITSEEDDLPKPKKPIGNREAVRKYRQKKKAQTAYLEEEVKKLRLINQQLVRKLQGQSNLEAEVSRLRSLLMDLRGKIDNEIGSLPFQKQCTAANGLECQINMPCFHDDTELLSGDCFGGSRKIVAAHGGDCLPAIIDCPVRPNNVEGHSMDTAEKLE